VYPVEILTQFAAFYDFGAATAAAIPMLIVMLAILTIEYRLLHNPILQLKAVTPSVPTSPNVRRNTKTAANRTPGVINGSVMRRRTLGQRLNAGENELSLPQTSRFAQSRERVCRYPACRRQR
jgi:hypothetical protein